ncbi:zinc finger transcription factor 1 [Lentinula edodes]|uniref:Zinc finger transcription factor 1 n=1 Tax=Lentinula edodes TaxID=5353 RepID=A0A1Q3ERZ6_LENED|nr:zinc finger transcription factor 1 [Lentinula edodes]
MNIHILPNLPLPTSMQFQHLSRKRQRQDSTDFASPVSLDTNWARENEYQQTVDLPGHRSTTFETTPLGGYATRPSIVLEPALTRELTNLFFTHSHPMVMIIHKPSFTNAVTMNQVPMYLLYAVCALASRHSKQPSLAATPRRLSGRHFADEARCRSRALEHGRSLPRSSVYELLAWEQKPSTVARNFTRAGGSTDQDPKLISPQGERFRQLTLQMLQELGVHKPTYPLLTPVPSQAFIEESIEKECVRRIFWLIYILDCMREIYYQACFLEWVHRLHARVSTRVSLPSFCALAFNTSTVS